MIDVPNRVQLVRPGVLLVETREPFPVRFNHCVMIASVVLHHGGGVELLADGHHFDASSTVDIITSLPHSWSARRLEFVGSEGALNDLGRLCKHLLSNGDRQGLPDELAYLREPPGS